jgi:hypothetical protein
MLLGSGLGMVSCRLCAVGVMDDWRDDYYFLQTPGRNANRVATELLHPAVRQIEVSQTGEFIKLALDDSPTKRYGHKVELAGTHHNPTPGPSGSEFPYGQVWGTIRWRVTHCPWGCIGMPLLALMYVRRRDLQILENIAKAPRKFRTKLVLAAELVEWCVRLLQSWFQKRVMVIIAKAVTTRIVLYGREQDVTFKTFLATCQPVGARFELCS